MLGKTNSLRDNPLRYEFAESPTSGRCMPVAPSIQWLRMPLPFAIGHINLWLLHDGPSWTIVDSGVQVAESQQVWHRTFATVMDNRPISRVIATHMHPDHVGCAGWLCEETGAPLWMTREEYLLCRVLTADTGRAAPEAGKGFYRAAGFREEQLHYYAKIFGLFGKYVSRLPESYQRISDGDKLRIGDNSWQIIVGRGHSPEHACLYCAALNMLISGDQLLPTISSNVSVYPTEPNANPLRDWLDSLKTLRQRVDSNVLVLPAHGKPFRGAHERIDALLEEHRIGLENVTAACSSPRRVVDLFPALFSREINRGNLIMATGETLANLNFLIDNNRISVQADAKGVNYYVRI